MQNEKWSHSANKKRERESVGKITSYYISKYFGLSLISKPKVV